MTAAIKWETYPARRFVVVGFDDAGQPHYLSTQPGTKPGLSHHTRREWSRHLNEATLYTSPDGAEKAMFDMQYGNKKRLPAPLQTMEVRRLSFVVCDAVAKVTQGYAA